MNVGKFGEDYTAEYLIKKGYCILERNFHSRWGEVDIIASNSEYLAFVEVKTRSAKCGENPSVFVDNNKQHKIIVTAQKYLFENDTLEISKLQPRFDVSALIINVNSASKIVSFDYFEDCFCQH